MTRLFPILCLVLLAPLQAQQLTLTWQDNSDNETGFAIERADARAKTFTEVATVGENVTTWADTTVQPGQFYVYRVRAFNDAGTSAPTNPAGATAAAPGDTEPKRRPGWRRPHAGSLF